MAHGRPVPGAVPVVSHLDSDRVGVEPERDVGMRRLCVLERVRQGFLDDSVRREVDACRKRARCAFDAEADLQTGGPDIGNEVVQPIESGLRREVGLSGA